jgi:hypothetical protein
MRSRSVSRRSAPSDSAVEGSLSRMRSRSTHRERGGQSWVSPDALFLYTQVYTHTHTHTQSPNFWLKVGQVSEMSFCDSEITLLHHGNNWSPSVLCFITVYTFELNLTENPGDLEKMLGCGLCVVHLCVQVVCYSRVYRLCVTGGCIGCVLQ